CATPALAASLARVHPEIAVLENQLDRVPPFNEKSTEDPVPIVAYAAGTDHAQDWATVRDAYNRAIADPAARGIEIETWIVGDAQEFSAQLIRLITDRPFARSLAREAHSYVNGHRRIDQHVSTWEAVYKRWHAKRGELLGAGRPSAARLGERA